MEAANLYQRSVELFYGLVRSVAPEDWLKPTPNSEWKVRDLVNHVAAEDLWIPPLLAGKKLAEIGNQFDGDVLGDEPQISASNAGQKAIESLAGVDLNTASVDLSRGATVAKDYVIEMFADHLIHAWDLASAINAERKLPDDLVEACYKFFQQEAENWRAGGAFAQAVVVPEDASLQDKLLALTGRDPAWK